MVYRYNGEATVQVFWKATKRNCKNRTIESKDYMCEAASSSVGWRPECMLTSTGCTEVQDIRWPVLWKEWQEADWPAWEQIIQPQQDSKQLTHITHIFHTKQKSFLDFEPAI